MSALHANPQAGSYPLPPLPPALRAQGENARPAPPRDSAMPASLPRDVDAPPTLPRGAQAPDTRPPTAQAAQAPGALPPVRAPGASAPWPERPLPAAPAPLPGPALHADGQGYGGAPGAASAPHAAAPLKPAARRMRPALLLIEPDYMLRRAVSLTAHELDIGDIIEATGYEAAARMLDHVPFDGLIVALGAICANDPGMDLIHRVRAGQTPCDRHTPIAVIAEGLDLPRVTALRQLEVARILVKPAKVKSILEALSTIARPHG